MKKSELVKILFCKGIEQKEAAAEVNLILETVLNKTKEELILIDDFDNAEVLLKIKERADTGRPIQYILGQAPFMGENFYVNENVLIPRDDTEILVREAFSKVKNKNKILDIGTGAGIIACMIAKLSKKALFEVEIIALDISNEALDIAYKNIKKLNLIRTVLLRKSDVFSNVKQGEKFDIIVSNPPYIPEKIKNTLQKEVLFEPSIALFAKDEGLYFYKKIIKEAPKFLNKGGHLLFEVMQGQSKNIEKFFIDFGYADIKTVKDVSGTERVIEGRFNG